MLSGLVLALSVAMSPGQCATCGPGGGMAFSPGMDSGSWAAGYGGGYNPYDAIAAGGGGGGDQLYPFDSPEPWLHGYFQEMPAYSGYSSFRPHNYKHILAQMQTAGRWGIETTMPFSHQWYHRYRQQSGMHPNWDTRAASSGTDSYQNYAAAPPAQRDVVQTSAPRQYSESVDVAALNRGYADTAIPGISTPTYQRSLATYRAMQTPSQQYQEQVEALQNQLEQQTFQIQSMQQQFLQQQQQQQQLQQARNSYHQAHSQFNAQPWSQPNHAQFQANPQSSQAHPPGTFLAPQSAVPAQPGMINSYPQYPGGHSQPYGEPSYEYGSSVPGMLPGVNAQAIPRMAPSGLVYVPNQQMAQPGTMSYQQNPGYAPQSSMMMTDPGMAPAMQQGYPQQSYPQHEYPRQHYFPQQGYPQQGYSQGYGPQAALTYGSGFTGAGMAQQPMGPSMMYQAQPIPTMSYDPYSGMQTGQ